MKNETLRVKNMDYNELVEKASVKMGVNVTTFLRISAIEKANSILSEDKK